MLLFVRRAPWGGYRPVAAAGAIQTNERLELAVVPSWQNQERAEKRVLDALDRLDPIDRMPPGPEREALEVEWMLDLLEDPFSSEQAVRDLLRNWRDRPDARTGRTFDASDLRARMSAVDLRRLVDITVAAKDTHDVLWSVALLATEVDEPRPDEALHAQLAHALMIARTDMSRTAPESVFGLDDMPEPVAFDADSALWVLAHRSGRADLMRRAQQYGAVPYLDDAALRCLRASLEEFAQ